MFQFRLKTFDNKKYWPHDKCLPKYNDGSAAPDDDDDDDTLCGYQSFYTKSNVQYQEVVWGL